MFLPNFKLGEKIQITKIAEADAWFDKRHLIVNKIFIHTGNKWFEPAEPINELPERIVFFDIEYKLLNN